MLRIRTATAQDVEAVTQVYDAVCDALDAHGNVICWRKGIYPARADAQEAIEAGTLWVAEREGEIVGTFIARRTQHPGYRQVAWGVACDAPVIVIDTLAVHPRAQGSGVGAAMLRAAEHFALMQGVCALRLDVVEKNLPAIRLYERCGFVRRGRVDIGLAALGLPWLSAYEKLL